MKFYLGERHNPQFSKPYYVSYGKLSKKDAKKKEESLYGSMYLTAFDTLTELDLEVQKKREAGYTVNVR